jgi:UDP-N-acetylglucosamine transferase subunit ALG13
MNLPNINCKLTWDLGHGMSCVYAVCSTELITLIRALVQSHPRVNASIHYIDGKLIVQYMNGEWTAIEKHCKFLEQNDIKWLLTFMSSER